MSVQFLLPAKTDPVIKCIIDGKTERLKKLIRQKDINGLYPFAECAEWEILKEYYITPLVAAVLSKNEEICIWLLNNNADPNMRSPSGWRPLHYASYSTMNILKMLLHAKADPSGIIGEGFTPLQWAVRLDREDVVKELILAGAFPYENYNLLNREIDENLKKLMKMISNIALESEDFVTIKLFLNFQESFAFKTPTDVFHLYRQDLFKEHPVTHLTLIEYCLSNHGPLQQVYQQTCIKILKEDQTLESYVEGLVKRFHLIPPAAKWHAVNSLDIMFCFVREIPLEVSLAVIPQLLECLSFGKYQDLQLTVIKLLYIVSQKTMRRQEGWDSSFVSEFCKCVGNFTKPVVQSDMRILAYGIIYNLLPFQSVHTILSSMNIASVPEDVLNAADIGMDEDIKEKLRQLNVSLKNPCSVTVEPKQDESLEVENCTSTKKKRKKKKKRKQLGEPQQEEANASASLIKDLTKEVLTTPQEPLTLCWDKSSVRWRQKLEQLSQSSAEERYTVGSITLVPNDNFQIAKGSDGTQVFLGLKDEGTEVAVKRMLQSNYQVLINECEYLRLPALDDPHIVRYIDFKEDKHFGYLVLQLCEYTVDEYIRDHLPTDRSAALKKIVHEVLHSLSVLHRDDVKILHRDIKPQNVLIDVTGKARLADFGISRRLSREETTLHTASAGTRCWKASETLDMDNSSVYKRSSDVQVAGMLIYYILSGGHHPFGKPIFCEANIFQGKYCLDELEDEVAKDLIEWMISKEPDRRPTVKEALAHPYFWDPDKKLEYLKNMGKQKEAEQCRECDEELLQTLDEVTRDRSFQHWKSKVPSDLMMKMDKRNKAYPETALGLLRFIRNLHEHYVEEAENINVMEIFPDLFYNMYMFSKKRGWNSRPVLKKSFKL